MTKVAIPENGERLSAVVQHATEFRCIVSVNGIRGRLLAPQEQPWSKYRVLFETGGLEQGQNLNVIVKHWEPRLKTLRLTLPQPSARLTNRQLDGRVVFIRARYVQAKRVLQNVIYAEINPGDFARVEVPEIWEAEQVFPIGSRIPLIIKRLNVYTSIYDAAVDWSKTEFSAPKEFVPGTELSAMVLEVAPYGARCLLDNRVVGFLHREALLGANFETQSLRDHLHLGDLIRVMVAAEKDPRHGTYWLDYIGDETPLETEYEHLELPIDTGLERNVQVGEGFSRDRNFRLSVIESYDETCCICGNSYKVGESNAMEAAHIIPRARRGRDSLDNGLCLCLLHHWAFDHGLLAIDEKLIIHVSRSVRERGDEGNWLAQYHGHGAFLENGTYVNRAALIWHMQHVFVEDE